MDVRELKDKASALFTKGKFAKAAETYEEFCALDRKDHQARLRCGDAWSKAGKKDKAIGAYSAAAEGFARDGFLPRAIAASKLVLEIDPAHKGVQKMLAELYAQKSGGARSSSPSKVAPAPEMEISRSVSAPITSNFTNRKDAIDLDAPVAKPKSAPLRGQPDVPSPMNRADALELPEYEIPMDDGPSSVGGMSAQKGPNPQRRADAIEIEVEAEADTGPKALVDTTIDIELSTGSTTGEVEIPIEGQPLPEADQLPPELQTAAPLAPAASFELAVDLPPPPAASNSQVYDLTDAIPDPKPSLPVFELTEEAEPPAPLGPPPEVLAAQAAAAQAAAAQAAAAQAAAAQAAAAQAAAAQAAASQAAAAQATATQAAATQAAATQAAAAEKAAEKAAAEKAAAEKAAAEKAAAEKAAAEKAAAEKAAAEKAAAGKAAAEKAAAEKAAAEKAAAEKAVAEKVAADKAAAAEVAAASNAAAARALAEKFVAEQAAEKAAAEKVRAAKAAADAAQANALPPPVGDASTAPPSIAPARIGEIVAPPASEGALPPGLKPRKTEPAPVPHSSPSSSRIWLPPAFTPAAPRPESSPSGITTSAPPPAVEPSTDLERSLQAFMKFDPDAPVPEAPASATPAPTPASFTELDLDGDSLLHAVEAASVSPALPDEEVMEAPEDPRTDPGALPRIPLFSDLPADAFIALFEKCPLQRFELGQLVFEQGDKADAFFVICAGTARVFRTDGGHRKDIATLEEGSFFGEMALLSEAPRSASVEAATEDTQVLAISAEVLKELSAAHPSVSTALKKFCRQRMLSNLMNTASIFAPFNRNDRRELVQKFRARDVNKGAVLVKEGQASDGLYVVLSGEVEIDAQGKRIATLKEGEVFGEMSLLLRSPASATVRALRHTSLLRLPKQDFDTLILSHPQVLEHVSVLIDSRRRADEQRASEMV